MEGSRFALPLSDAHAHLSTTDPLGELAYRRDQDILTCFSCGTPEEWERVAAALAQAGCAEGGPFLTSFGIHPWEAASHAPRECPELYERCDAVGEIGLDTVWCEVPLARQVAVFETQLQLAADLGRPVVLHTKGAEERVAAMIEGFPGAVLVHWYSGPLRTFECFAEQGCSFTLGPDCADGSELHRIMMTTLPPERLLAETDGLEGILWARGSDSLRADPALIGCSLAASMEALARIRDMQAADMARQLRANMRSFYDLN